MNAGINNNQDPSFQGQTQNDELNLQDIFRVAFSHLGLIASTVIFCAGLALAYALFWPPTYEAVTTIKVPDSTQSPTGMLKELVPIGSDPVQTYVEICRSSNVAQRAVSILKLAALKENAGKSDIEIGKGLLDQITVTNVLKSNIISINAKSGEPKQAAALANAWADSFIAANLDLSHKGAESKRAFLEDQAKSIRERLNNPALRLNEESKADEIMYGELLEKLQEAKLAEDVDDTGIVVVDQATQPRLPVSPKKFRSLALGILLGFFAGLQLAFLLDRLRDRIKHEKVLQQVTGLPNYAVIPDFREDYPASLNPPDPKERFSPKALIQNPVFSHAYYRESFKVLRTNLTLALADKPLQAFMILSPGPEEGKTLVNANLAISLAEAGKKTLLVDADLRKSSVRKIFGLENRFDTGLPLALTGQKPWNQMTRPSGVEHLDLLPNTVTHPNPAELLGSASMRKLIEEMKDEYDYIVFDAPPVLPVTDAVVLSTLLDAVVLMVRFNATRSSDASRAMDHLKRVGTKVVGTIINCVSMKKNLYGYGYGYGNYRYAPNEQSEEKTKK